MDLGYEHNYFLKANPNIEGNENLREPQVMGLIKAHEHFIEKGNDSHAIEILPTGVGKTGLMGLLPYGICEGRALIITPQLTIKDEVLDSLDPSHYENFWLKRNVFEHKDNLPIVIEYDGDDTPNDILEQANIVVLNIHKLQKRLDSSLINRVPEDFFDMIIIDEAHHSSARTWVEAVNYFSEAKVVKVTGTPFRSDDKPIVGEEIYKYKLSAAMANEYVKTLENFTYVPEEIYLTIDDKEEEYTVDEIYEMGIRDEAWVSRSVAYSKECSEKVVDVSIEKLEQKLEGDNPVPHKIISVACSIKHAKQIKNIYESKGYNTAIIHSNLNEEEKEEALKDIENHRVQVVVNVAMLGEGYDHPYLSVGAIFRPFRSKLPYVQFVGRILRFIPEEETTRAEDNIGSIVSHKHLELDDLWNYYKEKMEEKDTIEYLKDLNLDDNEDSKKGTSKDMSIGEARESGSGQLEEDAYLKTELMKKYKKERQEKEKAIKQLQETLGVDEEQAEQIYNQANSDKSSIKRPDVYFKDRRKEINTLIQEDIIPELISEFNIEKEGTSLSNCRLFNGNNSWIASNNNDNAAMLAIYFNNELKNKIGRKRSNWDLSDMEIAHEELPYIKEYVTGVLENYLNNQ